MELDQEYKRPFRATEEMEHLRHTCCHEAAVVDANNEMVCECIRAEDAELLAALLNKQDG